MYTSVYCTVSVVLVICQSVISRSIILARERDNVGSKNVSAPTDQSAVSAV